MLVRLATAIWQRSQSAHPKIARTELFRPVLEGLEERWTPTKYEWHGTVNGGPIANAWSSPSNWWFYDATQGAYVQQNPASASYPGAVPGDGAVFDGSVNNTDCYQDIANNGVTVDSLTVDAGYSGSIILSNPLTVSILASLSSGSAGIRGSAPGAPAARGTLNLTGFSGSILAWNAGAIENLTINVGGFSLTTFQSATLRVNDSDLGMRQLSGSDINVDGVLSWNGGNVSVISPGANSNINIDSGGAFNIGAANATWGVGAGDNSFFKINNYSGGIVQLNASGTATLNGDYLTDGVTELDVGILKLGGRAEQGNNGGGEFRIRGNTTVELAGTGQALRIFDGEINGIGRVDGNLTLGYDPNLYPDKLGGGMLMPGYLTLDPNLGHEVYVPGTLTVTQSFQMFGDYSSIETGITDSGTGLLAVTGTATLTSALVVDLYIELEVGTYSLISAGAVNGTFSGVWLPYGNDDPDNPLEYDLEYNGTSVDVYVHNVAE